VVRPYSILEPPTLSLVSILHHDANVLLERTGPNKCITSVLHQLEAHEKKVVDGAIFTMPIEFQENC
jgi:hypothetical protein